MTNPLNTPKKKIDPKKLIRFVLLMDALLIMAVIAWAFIYEDFDFYRPAKVPICQSAPLNSQPFRFIAFGDYGQGTPFQAKLGEQMAKTYDQTPFDTALLLGDNIYPDGDIKKLAKSHFETPYKGLIKRKVQFLASIGDHDDYQDHEKDQMAYFGMPNDYYKVSKGPVEFFILNTTFFVRSPEQRAWIEKSLANSKAHWKIVITHHPVYSSGKNGNTEGMRAILEPLLIKYGVHVHLAGHDHDYERLGPVKGVNYFVSGGGGSYLYGFKAIQPESKIRLKTHHFLLFEATPEHLWMKAINRHGDVIDCLDWGKPDSSRQPDKID